MSVARSDEAKDVVAPLTLAPPSAEQFRLLVGSVQGYAIMMLDTAGRVVSWNVGAERIKGYRPEEIIGRSFEIFYLSEDLQKGIPARHITEAAEAGHLEYEEWRVRADGSRFWADVVIRRCSTNRVGYSASARSLVTSPSAGTPSRNCERARSASGCWSRTSGTTRS